MTMFMSPFLNYVYIWIMMLRDNQLTFLLYAVLARLYVLNSRVLSNK